MGHKWSEAARDRERKRLSPELIDKICDIISDGNYARTACRALGVPFSTFYEWRARGLTDPDSLCGTFRAALEMAEAERESELVKKLKQAAGGERPDWRAHAHLLARLYPERWSERARGDGEEEQAALFNIDQDALLERLTDGELRTLMELLGKAAGNGSGEDPGASEALGFHTSSLPGIPDQLASPALGKKT